MDYSVILKYSTTDKCYIVSFLISPAAWLMEKLLMKPMKMPNS